MKASKLLVWTVILGSLGMLCGGCRNRRPTVRHYKIVIGQLEDKAARLDEENKKLRGDLLRAALEIERLARRDAVWARLSDDLRIALHGTGAEVLDTGVVRLPDSILFKAGYYEVRPEGRQVLQKIAKVFKNREELLRIDGHTDNVPVKYAKKRGIKNNRHLSAMRSLAVIEVLAKSGIAPRRMVLAGFGEYQPVADNTTANGKKKNRRVEIVVISPMSMTMPTGGEKTRLEK